MEKIKTDSTLKTNFLASRKRFGKHENEIRNKHDIAEGTSYVQG